MDRDNVVAAICKLTRRKPEELQGSFTLASCGLSASFGLTALRTLLESQGCGRLPVFTAGLTVDSVADLVSGTVPAADASPALARSFRPEASDRVTSARPVAVSATGMSAAIGLGMDMQEISSFPSPADFREDPFYVGNFTAQELATAVLRPDPRAHLCGLFCAKEAAKKSHPALLEVRMSDLSVLPDETGRPVLRVTDSVAAAAQMRFLISITHTESVAAATCVVLEDAS